MKKLLILLFSILLFWSPKGFTDVKYPVNNDSYDRTEKEVGCLSKYSKEKKNDIFISKYKNHWMTWKGEVVTAKSDSVTMDVNNFGIDDLEVVFENPGDGYDLLEEQKITVKFLMKSSGGCFLNFKGERATIVSDAKKVEGKRKEEEGHFFANMICEEFKNSAGPIPTEAVSLLAAIGIDPEAGSNFNSSFNTKFCDCVQKRTRLRISPERIKEVNRKYKINPNADNLTNDSEGLFFASLAVTCSLFP
jgi:hypothetical protein